MVLGKPASAGFFSPGENYRYRRCPPAKHQTHLIFCGERACSRWVAQQPQNLRVNNFYARSAAEREQAPSPQGSCSKPGFASSCSADYNLAATRSVINVRCSSDCAVRR